MGREPLSSATLWQCLWVAVAALTSHVSHKSAVSKIIFPLASFGISSSPGWNTMRREDEQKVVLLGFFKNDLPGAQGA